MSNFRDRFEEEVERIGGVTAISRVLGVARNTIYNWMSKGNVPLRNLMALRGVMGMDVVYVITGERDRSALNRDETELLRRYDATTAQVRAAVMAALSANELPGGHGVTVTGDGNRVIGRDYHAGSQNDETKNDNEN